jgi:hypothetical protein
MAPTPAPTPTPAPVKTPYYEHFVVGDYMISPTVYNEFSPGNKGKASYTVRGAIEIPLFSLPVMIGADWRHWQYPHNAGPVAPCPTAGCVTIIGGGGQTYVPSFTAQENDVDARLGFRIANPRVYIAASYLWENTNYGYPASRGWGFGLEKLPDLDQTITLYGSVYYYPNVYGYYGPFQLAYRTLRYQVGADWNFLGPSMPVFLDVGFLGNYATNKNNAPSNTSKYGGYVGLGIHF